MWDLKSKTLFLGGLHFWLCLYVTSVSTTRSSVSEGGNLTIGRSAREDFFPGPIRISCSYCHILFYGNPENNYYPTNNEDDANCAKSNQRCTIRKKCCTGQGLKCDRESDEFSGKCKYDYSCKTHQDCTNKGSSWKGYVCRDGTCVKGSACVQANGECSKTGRKCCGGQALYCHMDSGVDVGRCKYNYSCKTHDDCVKKGSSWKGYTCDQNKGMCVKIPTCGKKNSECDQKNNKCCYGYHCVFGQLRGFAGEGVCQVDYTCRTNQDCSSKGHKGWKCANNRCYRSLCQHTHKCNNTVASHRAKCCLPFQGEGACLHGECLAPDTCVEMGDRCREDSDCCGNNQNSNTCRKSGGGEWGRCQGCVELASGHKCRNDGECCGDNECDAERAVCHVFTPKCVQNGFFCFVGGTPCCGSGSCTFTLPEGSPFPITICKS